MDAKVTGAVVAAFTITVGGLGALALRPSKLQSDPLSYRVYAEMRGDRVVPMAQLHDGGWLELKEFPCAMRPAKAPVSSCTRVDGSDPGEENLMQPGQWKGDGCVRTACVERAR